MKFSISPHIAVANYESLANRYTQMKLHFVLYAVLFGVNDECWNHAWMALRSVALQRI